MVADRREGFRYGRVTPDGKAVLGIYRRDGIGADFAQIQLLDLATKETKTLTTDGYDARLTQRISGFRPLRARLRSEIRCRAAGRRRAGAGGIRCAHARALSPPATGRVGDRRAGLCTGRRCRRRGTCVGEPARADRVSADRAARLRHVRSLRRRPPAGHPGERQQGLHPHLRHRTQRVPSSACGRQRRLAQMVARRRRAGVYEFAEDKPYRLLVQRMDSDRPPVVVVESQTRLTPSTWSPDGQRITSHSFRQTAWASPPCLATARRRRRQST